MNESYPILAIETSDKVCGACIYFNDEKYFSSKIILRHSHSEKLFEVIKSVIDFAKINYQDLAAIAVSNGPGSFTGLRIGMSAAKGIAQGASLPIIPVPTFEALAFQLSFTLANGTSFIIANKVGKDELYFARFFIKSNNYIFQEELKIIHISEFEDLSRNSLIFGNTERDANSDLDLSKSITAPDPEFIAKWAVLYGKKLSVTDFDFLEPEYIKNFLVKERKK
jgi:tRNA threonylcarbamoyladenosine biosynthesis protein TsaB